MRPPAQGQSALKLLCNRLGFLAIVLAAAPASAATIGAADYEAAIARLERYDTAAPQALNARLQYADFLANQADGDCHARLERAQGQLDIVAARPAARILLPLGAARLAGAQYKIHAARADCDASAKDSELAKALDAAREAVAQFRAGLDYQSAAIMQFNVAATLRALGDNQAATAALQNTIALDREFGFRDDGADNLRLLQHWQGGDESDAHVAELMKDFPGPRTATLKFAWGSSDATVAIRALETNLTEGKVVESSGAVTLQRHVRPDASTWAVSYDPGNASADLGTWPADRDILKRFTAYMLCLALLETPKYRIEANGDFHDLPDGKAFSKTASDEIATRFGNAPGDEKALGADLKNALSPYQVENRMAEQHSLETATWAGAALQQGESYQMQAPLFLPGMGLGQYFIVTHDITFSFARQLGCTPDDAAKSCVEIVVHATPAPADLAKVLVQMASLFHMKDFDILRFWSSTNLRLVVKPATLEPVLSDMRRSWYVDVTDDPAMGAIVSSERIVTTTAYH